ncbi:hypothetical protein D3C75_945170 [compost metagenome]
MNVLEFVIEMITKFSDLVNALDRLAPYKPEGHWMHRHRRAIKIVSNIAATLLLIILGLFLFSLLSDGTKAG